MCDKITVQSVETNVLYMGVMALDLILRDAERRMRAAGGEFRYEKKMTFNRFIKSVKDACLMAESLQGDVIKGTEKSSYRDYDIWLGEANELARLILTFADKATIEGNSEAVFDTLESLKGEEIITEDVLQRFYFAMMPDCLRCAHRRPRYWSKGDDEEMRSFCFERRVYEPDKVCDSFKDKEEHENQH